MRLNLLLPVFVSAFVLSLIQNPLANALTLDDVDWLQDMKDMETAYFGVDYHDEVSSAEARLERAKELHGDESPYVARATLELGEMYMKDGQVLRAKLYFEKAVELIEITKGTNHPEVVPYISSLAECYRALGYFEKAKQFYKKCMALLKAFYGDTSENVVITSVKLAELYKDSGEYDKAIALFEESISILEESRGPTYLGIAVCLHHLAELHIRMDQLDQAEGYYQRILEVLSESMDGGTHPQEASVLNNLGHLYTLQGRYHDAVQVYEKAIDTLSIVYGMSHHNTQIVKANLEELRQIMSTAST